MSTRWWACRARIGGNQLVLNAAGGGTLTLAKLSSLVDSVPFSTKQEQGMKRGEGIRKILYMNRTLRNKIDSLITAQTGSLRIDRDKDSFGNPVEMFRDSYDPRRGDHRRRHDHAGLRRGPRRRRLRLRLDLLRRLRDGLVHGRFRTRGGGKRSTPSRSTSSRPSPVA
jgi:hypothetical protein